MCKEPSFCTVSPSFKAGSSPHTTHATPRTAPPPWGASDLSLVWGFCLTTREWKGMCLCLAVRLQTLHGPRWRDKAQTYRAAISRKMREDPFLGGVKSICTSGLFLFSHWHFCLTPAGLALHPYLSHISLPHLLSCGQALGHCLQAQTGLTEPAGEGAGRFQHLPLRSASPFPVPLIAVVTWIRTEWYQDQGVLRARGSQVSDRVCGKTRSIKFGEYKGTVNGFRLRILISSSEIVSLHWIRQIEEENWWDFVVFMGFLAVLPTYNWHTLTDLCTLVKPLTQSR